MNINEYLDQWKHLLLRIVYFIELIVCSNYHVAMLTEICLTETLLT